MNRLPLVRLLAALLALTVLSACSSDDGAAPPADSGNDAMSFDGSVGADGSEDASVDVAPDVPRDVPGDLTGDVLADTAPLPWPPYAPALCGAAPYEWLPPADVGAVVDFRRLQSFHTFSAAQLDALLGEAGYGHITPVRNGVTVYRLRYVTQDRGVLREATAAVGIPDSAAAGEAVPVGLWLHHSVGFVDDCAPTRNATLALVAPALLASQGYLSVAPDLLGLIGFGEGSPDGVLHPYLVGEPTAIAALDAVRAAVTATRADEGLPNADPARVIAAGGSQGGHATFFVERIAPHYAPDLQIVAAAAIVPPTDLRALATHAASVWGPPSRVLPTFLATMRNWYGAPSDMAGVLTDTDPHHLATEIETVLAARCRFELRLEGVEALDDLFEPDFLAAAAADDWESVPPWGCFLDENSLSTTSVPRVSDVPFYVVFAEEDELIQLATETADVERLCDQGYRIEVTVCGGLAHTEGGQATFPLFFDWLRRQLEGVPLDPAETCVIPPPIDCEAL